MAIAAAVLFALPVGSADASPHATRPPDLVVRSLAAPPERLLPGAQFTAEDVTLNDGGRKARESATGYFLAGAGLRLGVGERAVPALLKDEESAEPVELRLPVDIADGAYSLVACADRRDDVAESDEDNNCRTAPGQVLIDTTPPAGLRLAGHPEDPTAETHARFEFSSDEPDATFACRIDAAEFEVCSSPVERSGLAEGTHRFEVKARDAAGNESAPEAYAWTIDLTPPPAPAFDDRPAAVTTANEAGFSFTAAEDGVHFECALDGGEAEPCESPQLHLDLPDGDHGFAVTARDAAGNRSAAATVAWTIVPDRLTLGDGAWSWFADPRAIRSGTRTYVGWVAGDGDIKVSAYDHVLLTRTTALVAPDVQVDDHANPALQVLPDGRIRVYYSAHGGPAMWYRTSLLPGDISAWEPPQRIPANSIGNRGFTYPNPLHLADEAATYLFWRGGNWQPTFSVQADGSDAWTPPRTLVNVGSTQRPYVKFASDGAGSFVFAFTNAHPREAANVNIYFAAYRDGALRKADGTVIGPLSAPIAPAAADKVYDGAENAWIHDVAIDAEGRPVIVFARFVEDTDHRYMYVRWTGTEWGEPHEITPAGGTFNPQPNEQYYSGGITLDHEDPSRVYLSRKVGDAFEVETWATPDGGATWPDVTAVTAGSPAAVKNVRPVSPRGLVPFSDDLSVVWMRGAYDSYIDYRTSVTTVLRTGGNAPPIAQATAAPVAGRVPHAVTFDAAASRDPDGSITSYEWDFGDGSVGTGVRAEHTYAEPGRYFPVLTVTDRDGATDRFVTEVVTEAWADVWTGPATEVGESAATLRGTVDPHGHAATYRFEYGTTTAYGAQTAEAQLAEGERAVEAPLGELSAGTYHYRLVATSELGTVAGADRVLVVPPPGPGAYSQLVRATPGLKAYWRLGELGAVVARDETGAHPGSYSSSGVRLGEAGALGDDVDFSAGFDGKSGEMSASVPAVTAAEATVEGWFDWRAGTAVMRDHTSTGGVGWILAYDVQGNLSWRVAGRAFTTNRTVASVRGGWHHFAITMKAGAVAFYVDGERVQTGSVTPANPAQPWHVMRNGNSPTEYTQGRADEVALYAIALTAADIKAHYDAGPP